MHSLIEPSGIKTNFIHHCTTGAIHPKYSQMIRQVKQFAHKTNDTLPEPDCVAKAIYRAYESDRSHRLRYSPHAEIFLLLHAMLHDRLWQRLVKA